MGGGLHNYSTQEQIVGKWIDGSDVYEKTYSTKLPSTTSWAKFIDLSEINATKIIYVYGIINNSKPFPYHQGSVYASIDITDTKIDVYISNGFVSKPIDVTIRYLK